MANANVPRGIIPARHFDGSVWNGSANLYYVSASYATSIFIGDPVVMVSSQNDANGIPAVQVATAGTGNLILGSMVGIVNGGNPQITVTQNLPIYRPASTAQYILVADDPNLMYEVQDDGTGTIANYNVMPGKNTNLVSGAGSTVTGYSGWTMSATTAATGNATYQVKIQRLLDQADNAQPPTANAKWLIKLNQFQLANGTVGA